MDSLRKKVGNFIAGTETSQQNQQPGAQQASATTGKHTALPVDYYQYPGLRFACHFITVDVTTVGHTTFGLAKGQTVVGSDITSTYGKLSEPYAHGFVLDVFKGVPGVGKVGWNASESPYQGIFSKPYGAPVYHSWQLLVVKSSIHTVERAGLLNLSARSNEVADASGIISVIAQYCQKGGRLICVELTGQRQSQGMLGKIGGKNDALGCDVFLNLPRHPNPTLYTYQLVNIPVQVIYLGPGKLVKVSCDWLSHLTSYLQQGWRLAEIFWDQGKRSYGDFTLSGEHNSVWFFERDTAKLKDLTPVYEGTIIEYEHTVKVGFFQTKASGDWAPMISEMGQRGWELACMLETPEVIKVGLGSVTYKILFFFQRQIIRGPPPPQQAGYPPSQVYQHPPAPGGYPMAGHAPTVYHQQPPPCGANYAPPPYQEAVQPSAPPPEKM